MFDRSGTILKHVRIGHAQTASVGKYLPDQTGLQLMCVNFWKNPGIISLFDHEGNLLRQEEPIHSGSPMLPVNCVATARSSSCSRATPARGA